MSGGPYKGPVIEWDSDEIEAFVEAVGFDSACERIASDIFQLEYVRETVRLILNEDNP